MKRPLTARDLQHMLGSTQDDGRPEHDFYNTCPEAVHSLLAMEQFSPYVWEPACGEGAIVKVLREHGYQVFASDLYKYETDIHAHLVEVSLIPSGQTAGRTNVRISSPTLPSRLLRNLYTVLSIT